MVCGAGGFFLGILAYVINLDRSTDRLQAVTADAAAAGLELIRVPAVDGKTVPAQARTILDETGFRRDHGKRPMAGEYGCYASHIRVLGEFLKTGEQVALVFEDDVRIPSDIHEIVAEIRATDDWDVVKLSHHRLKGLRPDRNLSKGRRLGRPVFGPTGSSAAYLVNRHAAERLSRTLVPMTLPYDVALERGWAHGLRVRHVRPDPVPINWQTQTTLAEGGVRYGDMKLKPWRRLTTLRFRTVDFVRRLVQAARP